MGVYLTKNNTVQHIKYISLVEAVTYEILWEYTCLFHKLKVTGLILAKITQLNYKTTSVLVQRLAVWVLDENMRGWIGLEKNLSTLDSILNKVLKDRLIVDTRIS